MKKGKVKLNELRCPECKSEDVAIICFEGEPTQMVCNSCEHEWED